jgi:hypothetical protein
MLLRALILFSITFSAWSQIDYFMKASFAVENLYPFPLEGQEIKGSPGLWLPVLKTQILDDELGTHALCFYFRLPDTQPGEWRWSESLNGKCDYLPDQKTLDQKKDIRTLKVQLDENKLVLTIEKEEKRWQKYEYPLMNKKRSNEKWELFSPKETSFGMKGVMLLAHFDKPGSYSRQISYPSEASDAIKTSPCGGVDSTCKALADECSSLCPSGFFIVPNGCPQGGPRFCGYQKCGGKEEAACFRGHGNLENMDKKDLRVNQSSVYCQESYKVEVVGDLAICR